MPESAPPSPRWRARLAPLALLAFVGATTAWAVFADRADAARTGAAFRSPNALVVGEGINGVSLSAPRREIGADALAPIAELGANWIAVIPYAFTREDDPRVAFDRERQYWGETAAGVAATVAHAREHGLRVLLKPHLWVRGEGWPGEFELDTDAEWELFEREYSDYILHFARLADSLDVEMFAVGTEVDRSAIAQPDYWRALIVRVRAAYGGALTYAANWDRYAEIEFWDALDYLGVDAYFPLSSAGTPDVETLLEAWEPWTREVERTARRVGLPILFTEFGYRSVDGAAGEQWTLPDGRRARGLPANREAQAAAYEALFRTWWNRDGFAGGFLWKWYPGTPDSRWVATDYTPQGKPAEAVIHREFLGSRSTR